MCTHCSKLGFYKQLFISNYLLAIIYFQSFRVVELLRSTTTGSIVSDDVQPQKKSTAILTRNRPTPTLAAAAATTGILMVMHYTRCFAEI